MSRADQVRVAQQAYRDKQKASGLKLARFWITADEEAILQRALADARKAKTPTGKVRA